jgi:hypothetical protein
MSSYILSEALSGLPALMVEDLTATSDSVTLTIRRATPTPVSRASAARSDNDRDDKPISAYLGLQMQAAPDGVWTVVQWQDSAGGWHDIEGWRGTLDGGQKIWWVAQRDFGTGPFRWVIYEGQGGRLLATSESFYLPASAEQRFWIEALSVAP